MLGPPSTTLIDRSSLCGWLLFINHYIAASWGVGLLVHASLLVALTLDASLVAKSLLA